MRDRSSAMTALTALLVLATVSLGGCGISQDAAADSVKAHLEEKYGEEFVIEASGGGFGTADNTTWKVIFHPASDPALKSYATIPKGGGDIKDYYTGERVARDLADAIEPEVANLLAGRALIRTGVSFEGPGTVETGGRDASASDYFSANPNALLGLAVLTDAGLTNAEMSAHVAAIAELVAPIAPNASVYLALVDAGTYDQMASSLDSSEKQDIISQSVNGRGAQAWIEGAEINVAPVE